MNVTLLSGVVRNRKITSVNDSIYDSINDANNNHNNTNNNNENRYINDYTPETNTNTINNSLLFTINQLIYNNFSSAFNIITSCTRLLNSFKLRVHKFTFQWDLVIHFFIAISSLLPFIFTGERLLGIIPLVIWGLYNILFLIGVKRANSFIPGFSRMKHAIQISMEEFFSPKLLPIISISFLLVALSLVVTGRRLGGPPLCYSSCGMCLSLWDTAIKLTITTTPDVILSNSPIGCGYLNGKELLGYYTMAQTSFLIFLSVLIAMSVCLAWRVAEEELVDRQQAIDWLKSQDSRAYEMREEIILYCGNPGSSIRPEGNFLWVVFGIVVALTFTLLGWHNWSVLQPSHTSTLLILLNLLTILSSTLILHLSFFGRLLSLYKRNYQRVAYLTTKLSNLPESDLDAWWNCRNFVLNDDLALDYDIGGLAVSATFVINLIVFITVIIQVYREGFGALMEAPGSYCAYACLYITLCLLKIFTLATNTFEEQFRHINGLQKLSFGLMNRSTSTAYLGSATFPLSSSHDVYDISPTNLTSQLTNPMMNQLVRTDSKASDSDNYGLNMEDESFYDKNTTFYNPINISNPLNNITSNLSSSSTSQIPNTQSNNSNIFSTNSTSSINLSNKTISLINKFSNRLVINTLSSISKDKEDILSEASPQLHKTINVEAIRQTVSDMIAQIRMYDPYPCILGIPVMPALFNTSKFYIFIFFVLIGSKIMISVMKLITQ